MDCSGFVWLFFFQDLKKIFCTRFIGHSLTPDDMVSLHDVYEELNANQKKMRASYVFQFLWRDLSSELDVIGPYFKSEAGMKHQFVMMCILNTTHAFHLYRWWQLFWMVLVPTWLPWSTSQWVIAFITHNIGVAEWYFSLHFCCEAACAHELYFMTVDNRGSGWKF